MHISTNCILGAGSSRQSLAIEPVGHSHRISYGHTIRYPHGEPHRQPHRHFYRHQHRDPHRYPVPSPKAVVQPDLHREALLPPFPSPFTGGCIPNSPSCYLCDNGVPCNDGNPLTIDDKCINSRCLGTGAPSLA